MKKTRSRRSISAIDDPATRYAKAVLAKKIVAGPHVRAACKRHIDDMSGPRKRGLRWNPVEAKRALDFFPDVLTVESDGKIIPFKLLPAWEFVVGSVFGWQRREGDRWVRRYDRAYIESGKGSGKTPLAGGVGLYMMTADGELSAEVYAAGGKREQAMRIFGDAVQMVDRSPQLRHRLVKSGRNPVWQLTHRPTSSIFKPLSADKQKSGQRVHCGLVDELHEHKERYTVDMLRAGFKGRKQPLLFVITNSGFDRNSICWEWHEHALAVLDGLRSDEKLFAFVMAMDPEDDPLESEACWPKTNPGIGVTITLEYLRGQVNEARQIPGREAGVRRLNFCEWTDADVGWMTRNAWTSIEEQLTDFEKPPDPKSLMGGGAAIATGFDEAELYLGLDLAFAFDLAALAFVFPEGDDLLAWIEYFTPIDTILAREKKDRVPYGLWVRQGLIHGIPGKVIRKEHIARRIAEVSGRFDVIWEAYDRYRHKELEAEFAELGVDVPMIEHPQGFRRGGKIDILGPDGKPIDNPLWMPESVRQLETRVIEKTIKVQPSPVTRWQVSGVAIRDDPAGTGNRIFDKKRAVGRIDGIVALAMGVGAAEMKLPSRSLEGFLSRPVMSQ